MNLTGNENVYTCYVPGCNKTYYFKDSLKRHVDAFHLNIKKFECEVCGKRFSQKVYLTEHSNLHTGELPYACDFPGCTLRFRQKSRLPIHKVQAHGVILRRSKRISRNTGTNQPRNRQFRIQRTRNNDFTGQIVQTELPAPRDIILSAELEQP